MHRTNALDFVERLRAKPEHVRRRIALGTTVGVTGVVAFGWLIALVLSGNLSLTPSSTPGSNGTLAAGGASVSGQAQTAVAQTQSGFSQLLGAVGVANPKPPQNSLTIVDAPAPPANTGAQSPTGNNQTIIPF